MNRRHLLLAALCLLAPWPAQAQPRGIDGIPLTKVPAVVIVGQSDARVPLVHAAVAHWNSVLAGIGSGFRLGRVSQGGAGAGGEPGKIVVVLSDGDFVSHVNRLPGGAGAVAMISNDRGFPRSLPNVMRNLIAHELGHTIGLGQPQQRVHRADEMPVAGDVDRDHFVPCLRLDVAERGERPENAGIADEHIQPPVALGERRAEPRDPLEVLEVERHQRRGATGSADRVVKLFETADGAGDRDHMRARARQRERGRVADAARGAGDERDLAGEGTLRVAAH